jgi:Protein of unknown function (DUF4012)
MTSLLSAPPSCPTPESPRSARRRAPRSLRSGRPRTPLGRAVLVLIGGYLAVSAGLLAWSALDALRGSDELDRLRRELGPADLFDGSASERLEEARSAFESAAGRVDGAWFAPMRVVPVVGRQVTSFEAVVAGAEDLTAAAIEGVDDAQATVGEGIPTGTDRVATLRELAGVAEDTAATLAAIDPGPDGMLLAPLGHLRDDLTDEKDELEETLLRSRDASEALADMLAGPSSYLLLAADNAEMRSGSGMLLSAGLMVAADGRMDVSDLEPTEDLVLDAGVGGVDPEIARLWGYAGPDRDFRNLLLSPRFGPSAEVAARMWVGLGRPPVDGVIVLDVVALEHLLRAVGPVEVDGVTVDADNVRSLLLHDQYALMTPDNEGQAARQDRLGDVAEQVLEHFDSSRPDPAALALSLRDAAVGRHLLVWSADEHSEQAWRGVHVAGEVPADGVLVSALNDGDNKLDQFLRLRAELRPEGEGRGTLRIQATNTVGPGEPPSVAVADPEAVGGYGVYPGLLAVSFPAGTRLDVTSGPEATVGGPDGASQVLAAEVRIAPGETVTWTVAWTLGQDLDELVLLPSARSPALHGVVDGDTWSEVDRPGYRLDLR